MKLMKNKQTAVDWLVDWMDKNQYFIGNDLIQAVEKAKEMEKKQITEAWNDGNLLGRNGHVLLPYDNGNGYYNEQINYITN